MKFFICFGLNSHYRRRLITSSLRNSSVSVWSDSNIATGGNVMFLMAPRERVNKELIWPQNECLWCLGARSNPRRRRIRLMRSFLSLLCQFVSILHIIPAAAKKTSTDVWFFNYHFTDGAECFSLEAALCFPLLPDCSGLFVCQITPKVPYWSSLGEKAAQVESHHI